MKICKKCGIEKENNCFHKNNQKKDGLSNVCKDCVNKKRREDRKNFSNEKRKELSRKHMEYVNNNPMLKEAEKKRKKEWEEKNREKINKRRRELYTTTKKIKHQTPEYRAKKKIWDKTYREKNKEKIAEHKKQYREKNKEKISKRSFLYREKNKEELNKKKSIYYEKNKEKLNKKSKEKYANDNNFKERAKKRSVEYRKNNKEKKRLTDYNYSKKMRETNPIYRLRDSVSANIRARIKKEDLRTYDYLGCSGAEYKNFIEKQFQDGMSWENYGKWQIDHIIPIIAFDINKKEEALKAFNYRNTRPLFSKENLAKSGKMDILLVEKYDIKDLLPENFTKDE